MIIYLIKLILILVFNTCVNICYINSGCKCCGGNSKSGVAGSGSKGDLGPNPLKGTKTPEVVKPKKGAHTGGIKSGEGNDLEGEKAFLTERLNQLIANNNALGTKKIGINIDAKAISSISTQTDFNNLNNEIDVLIKEYENKKISTLKDDCLIKLNECRELNKNLLEKLNLYEFSEESIQNENDIDRLNKIFSSISIKYVEISKKLNYQKKLLNDVESKNKTLILIIQGFFKIEVRGTKFDKIIRKASSISQLEGINKELDYILKKVVSVDSVGDKQCYVIYYDEFSKDLNKADTYRLMVIMDEFLSHFLSHYENFYSIFESKDKKINPFKKHSLLEDNMFHVFEDLILKSDIFRSKILQLLKNIHPNSYFANMFKCIFSDKIETSFQKFNLSNPIFVSILDSWRTRINHNLYSPLNSEEIEIGDTLRDEGVFDTDEYTTLKELNEEVYGLVEKCLEDKSK